MCKFSQRQRGEDKRGREKERDAENALIIRCGSCLCFPTLAISTYSFVLNAV